MRLAIPARHVSLPAALTILSVISLFISATSASSSARNPLKSLAVIHNPTILTPSHRVHALSHFDLAFDLYSDRLRLSLEPNHDILASDARVNYLNAAGEIERSEPINRADHRVFKGTAWRRNADGWWTKVGWARITVHRDGLEPLFDGAFEVLGDFHHIQLSTAYMKTRVLGDPVLDLSVRPGEADGDFMVCYRDSDIMKTSERTELRRDVRRTRSCTSDELEFNTSPDHPIFAGMLRRDDTFWSVNVNSLFGKRQVDGTNSAGGGNSAGTNLLSTIGSTKGCPTTRKIALVGVATDCTYTGDFNSTESTRANIISVMNSASSVYEHTFNITLGLANLTISSADCPGSPSTNTPWNQACSDSVDISDRLSLFSAWRGQQSDGNSHWTLLSTCNTGSAVGLSWLGQACMTGSQTSNTSTGTEQTVAGANFVARTGSEWQVVAHETGHTFGAVHDCTSETCNDGTSVSQQQCCPLSSSTCSADDKYIMSPATSEGISSFSACSVGNICSAFARNSVKSDCFSNNKNVTTITGQQCGNGIVEDGEDCDCGGESGCGDNQCCNPTTCKFVDSAVCDDSNEDCCTNCQYSSNTTVCRASNGACDPAETCPGNSPYCPTDKTEPDGTSCGDGLKCASGQCTSRDQQCRDVASSDSSSNSTSNSSVHACTDALNPCLLSCEGDAFDDPDQCYYLNQNFLDGTECGSGGGKCQNGVCANQSVGKEIKEWIKHHRALVIGLACGVGGFLVLSIAWCCYRRFGQKRREKRIRALNATMGPGITYWGTPTPPMRQHRRRGPPGPGPRGYRGNPDADWISETSLVRHSPPGSNGGPNPPPGPPPAAHARGRSVRYA